MKALITLLLLFSTSILRAESIDYTKYVNPFIGTANDGTTYPGAVAPFGMLQWSPDTGDRIGGYHYDDTRIRGFSVYRVSGTGGLHGQDLPFMPTVGPLDRSPVNRKDAYASAFSHKQERAAPGQYQVRLIDSNIDVDLAVTTRSGLGAFRFPQGSDAAMVLHPTGRIGEVYEAHFTIDPLQRKISGHSFGSGAINGYAVYFVAQFDHDFSSYGFWKGANRIDGQTSAGGKDIAAWLRFDTRDQTLVKMKIAVSYVSLENAEENLRAEIPHWDLQKLKDQTQAAWNAILSRIAVDGGTADQRTIFYTALYHASLHPNIFNDVNGQYIDMDEKIQVMPPGHNKYVNYSLWDVYRTIPQLQALLQPQVMSDMVQSLLLDSQQCQGGGFPVFGILNSAPGIMCGYPADPFMASAYAFGARDFDVLAVQKKMVLTAMNQMPCGPEGGAFWHMDDYKKGYVAHESTEWGSISYNIEYAVADFSVAMMSAAVGDREQAEYFLRRSQNWQNLFNPAVGYMQERYRNGQWVPGFSPTRTEGFMEGNAVQQSLMVPHNIGGVLEKTQQHHPIEPHLDHYFSRILTSGWPTDQPYYWAGNEPVIGMPWYYNWLQKPWKTQDLVRRIMGEAYKNAPGGLPGNDDLGTMSAWYVFAALGLYPEIPGVAGFSVHAPLFPSARMSLGDGRVLVIEKDSVQPYIQNLEVNGESHRSTWLALDRLIQKPFNTLRFEMGSESMASWGTAPADIPPSFDAKGLQQVSIHGMADAGRGTPVEVFDRNLQTNRSSSVMEYKFEALQPINAYTIAAGSNSSRLQSWRVEGSRDGQQWTVLDERHDISFMPLETQSFSFTSCENFRHFRLQFSDAEFSVAEWALYARPIDHRIHLVAEAEGGVMQNFQFANSRWGYSGNGYAGVTSQDWARIEIPFESPQSGVFSLRVRYALNNGDRSVKVTVNGLDSGTHSLVRAYHYREADAGSVTLKEGLNHITLEGQLQNLDLDALIAIAQGSSDSLHFEAEWGIRDQTQKSSQRAGYWGDSYVTGFEDSGRALRVPFCVPESGMYRLSLRYASPYGDKWNSLYLNGIKVERLNFTETKAFSKLTRDLPLTRGRNALMIRVDADDWGWIEWDAFQLEKLP